MNATDDRAAILQRLHDELAAEVDERVAAGRCGCGCTKPLPGNPGRRKYVNERHRQRSYRNRLEREARALGVTTRLSLSSLQTPDRTREHHADAHTPGTRPQRRRSRPRPGVTLYLPTLDAAERLQLVLCALRAEPKTGGSSLDELAHALDLALARRRTRA